MREGERGFLKLVIVIIIFIILSAYFDLDVRRLLDLALVRDNWANLKQFLVEIGDQIERIINYLTNLAK